MDEIEKKNLQQIKINKKIRNTIEIKTKGRTSFYFGYPAWIPRCGERKDKGRKNFHCWL